MPPHQGDDWASMHGYRSMLINDDDTRSLASTSVSRPRGRAARGGELYVYHYHLCIRPHLNIGTPLCIHV